MPETSKEADNIPAHNANLPSAGTAEWPRRSQEGGTFPISDLLITLRTLLAPNELKPWSFSDIAEMMGAPEPVLLLV